jgi:hypothetical protein
VVPRQEVPPLGQLEDFAASVAAGNAAPALSPVTGKVLTAAADTLFCSLDHEIVLVEL